LQIKIANHIEPIDRLQQGSTGLSNFGIALIRLTSGVQYRLHTNIMLLCNPAGRVVSRLRRIEQAGCALPQTSVEQDNFVSSFAMPTRSLSRTLAVGVGSS
ncbi:hypothetical protein CTA2_5316, partial [Colletotrichum tanaceti]